MKTPSELAARLRKMVLAAQHHYSPQGEPMRSIVVSPEWLEDLADAANRLDGLAPVSMWREQSVGKEFVTTRGPKVATIQAEQCRYPACQFTGCPASGCYDANSALGVGISKV